MNKSLIVKDHCPNCGKIAVEVSRSDVGEMLFIRLECKHTIIQDKGKTAKEYDIISSDGRVLRPFQVQGIQFGEESNFRCLVADEMGLGKTVQALGILKLHPELLPALFVVKSALKQQWFAETIRWCGMEYLPQVIPNSKQPLIPGFPVYIVSFDMLRRMTPENKQNLGIKTVVIDECQKIKNHLSARAKEVQLLCKDIEHIICLSGTPITNNAGEYFTVLNLLQPRRFPEYNRYINEHCDAYESGWTKKVGGLSNPNYFHELTQDFIIRRTRAEVAPELPTISRNFFHVELQKKFEHAYDAAVQELEDNFMNEGGEMMSAIQIMTKMRHIVGWNKIQATVDFVEDFLLDTNPERKLTIFTHHLDVTEALVTNLKTMLANNTLDIDIERITAAQTSEARADSVNRFQFNPKARLCVASTQAAGEGLNMQFCDDCILMERQWTPATEEQVEGRFIRIGRLNELTPVTATYMIASGTIDEFFTEIVEQKRSIVSSTLDNKEIAWNEQGLMKELMDVILAKGGKRWKLK